MIVGCVLAGLTLGLRPRPGRPASILIGFFTGFYLVPLFTLLQHRAPKTSKGDMIATSNFINVTGAILASVLFFAVVAGSKKAGFLDRDPDRGPVRGRARWTRSGSTSRGRPVYFRVGDVAVGHPATRRPAARGLFDLLGDLVRS